MQRMLPGAARALEQLKGSCQALDLWDTPLGLEPDTPLFISLALNIASLCVGSVLNP